MAIKKHGLPNNNVTETPENEIAEDGTFSNTFKKSCPKQLLRGLIENNDYTNVRIKIDEFTMDCHSMVLQCYSGLFQRHDLDGGLIVELPAEKVSSKTFVSIYKWMLEDTPLVQRTEAMELLIAACYLEVKELITQIWGCLNDVENLPGDAAYFLYLEANIMNVKCVRETMLSRISKFFLIMVAFKEFLLMPANDLCTLLNFDSIGVNTEIEVFMVVLRWLGYDWSNRRIYIESLMKNVRLHLIPPGFLIELDRNMIETSIIRHVMSRRKVRELVRNGLKYATAHLCYGKFIEDKSGITERHWIYDDKCEYHIKSNQLIDYKITYQKFQDYLRCLQKCNHNYWKGFVSIGTNGGQPAEVSIQFPLQDCKVKEQTIHRCGAHKLPQTETHPFSKENENNDFHVPEILNTSMDTCDSHTTTYRLEENVMENLCPELGELQTDLVEASKPNLHTTIYELEEELKEISYQSGNFSHGSEVNFFEPAGSKTLTVHHARTNDILISDNKCEYSTFVSVKSEIEPNRSSAIEIPQTEESSQSEDSSDAGSYVSVLSYDRISKAYSRRNGSYIMSIKSMSQKNISIKPIEKNPKSDIVSNDSFKKKPFISARSHKLEFKGLRFDPILDKIPSTPPSKEKAILINFNNKDTVTEKSNEKGKEDKSEKITDDLLSTTVVRNTATVATSCSSIFPRRTLLILGGTDPYHQHGKNAINFIDKMLFYSDRFKKWAQLPQTSFGTRQHHAAVVCNEIVYIVGGTKVIPGCKKTFFETSIWALNPKTKNWTFETNLPKNRRDFAVVSFDGEPGHSGFFVIGGESFDKEPLNSVWFYNVKRKVWIRKASLKTPRYGFSAAIVKNEIWIAGGIAYSLNTFSAEEKKILSSRSYSEYITDTIETFKLDNVLNESKGVWIESKFRLRQQCLFGKLCATTHNEIFLIGGIGHNLGETLQSFDAIDKFDFETEKWVQCGKLQSARHGHDVVLVDNCIGIIGGVSSQKKLALQSIEFFCTLTFKTSKFVPDLPRPLSGLAAVILKEEW